MSRNFFYTLRREDLEKTSGGAVGPVMKFCMNFTGREISRVKFADHGITVDGEWVHVSDRILPGQTLCVTFPENDTEKMAPLFTEISVLYEDEDLILVDKPAGMVSHPSPGHFSDTMGNAVEGYFEKKGESHACRVIGRLDKETSGILIFAKNRIAAGRLQRQGNRAYERTYYAICEGVPDPPEGLIDLPVEKVPDVLMLRRIAEDGKGEPARTHFRVLAQGKDKRAALAEFHLETGRTHQIRLHMAAVGHPLVGDTLYGLHAQRPDETGHISSMPGKERALLHAGKVTLIQPFTGEQVSAVSPVPEDFCRAMEEYGIEYDF